MQTSKDNIGFYPVALAFRPFRRFNICVFVFLLAGNLHGQQWNGSNTIAGDLFRQGRVGIGISAPSFKLDVAGSAQFDGNIWIRSEGRTEIANENNTGLVLDPLAQKVHLEADNNIILTAAESGHVGIGTESPGTLLDLRGAFSPVLRVTSTDIDAGGIIHLGDADVSDYLVVSGGNGGGPYEQGMFANHADLSLGTMDAMDIRFVTKKLEKMRIDQDGRVGIGVSAPLFPLQMSSGAYVSSGGVWTNASSAEYKENIRPLPLKEALEAIESLRPVVFNYRADPAEAYVGFIAEDVPELVAVAGRRGVAALDVVATLTRVVQLQRDEIKAMQSGLQAQQRITGQILSALSGEGISGELSGKRLPGEGQKEVSNNDVEAAVKRLPSRLERNFPNPFNPVTTIRYELADPVQVRLTIHDLLGRVVRTLVNETQRRGAHQVLWDGRGENGQTVPSGTYFSRLMAGGLQSSQKIIMAH